MCREGLPSGTMVPSRARGTYAFFTTSGSFAKGAIFFLTQVAGMSDNVLQHSFSLLQIGYPKCAGPEVFQDLLEF